MNEAFKPSVVDETSSPAQPGPVRRAVVIGGGGQVGRAAAAALQAAGWQVTAVTRGALPEAMADAGVRGLRLDREAEDLRPIGGADLVVDCVAYDHRHAEQLLEIQDDVGAFVVISSSSVYRDERGRTLDEAWSGGFPELPEPMTEDQPTVDPGPATYSTRKAALERRLLDGARTPAVVLRPGAIHGVGSRSPREWFFVKRVLDGRKRVPVAYGGAVPFQTSSARNIAALAAAAAARPATGVFNAPDPTAPGVAEIGRSIAAAMNADLEIVGLDDPAYPTLDGLTPWLVQRPFVLSDAAARAAGYRPVETYASAMPDLCRWLVEAAARPGGWRAAFPDLAATPVNLFDYDREDALLAGAGPSSAPDRS